MKIIKSTAEVSTSHTHRTFNSIWICVTAVFSIHKMQSLRHYFHYYTIKEEKKQTQFLWPLILYSTSQATVALRQRFNKFLPNTLPCQALGGLQSIKHFQFSRFLIHSGKPRRLKEMNTQRYSIHLLLAVLTSLFKQLLLSALGSWKRQVGISQPEYLFHAGKKLLWVKKINKNGSNFLAHK